MLYFANKLEYQFFNGFFVAEIHLVYIEGNYVLMYNIYFINKIFRYILIFFGYFI